MLVAFEEKLVEGLESETEPAEFIAARVKGPKNPVGGNPRPN